VNSGPDDDERILKMLKESLLDLASPAEAQLKLFFPAPPCIDDLAIEFDHWYRAATTPSALPNSRINSRQELLLKRIDTLLDEMSGEENQELWTIDALKSNPKWERIRELAKEALELFR
jgi:hypothetical protein